MSELQDRRVFKQRAWFERLALASVAHRIGEDSILIVMATTIPARHVIDKAIPTRRPTRWCTSTTTGISPPSMSSRSISVGERDDLSGASHPVLPVETIIQLLTDAYIDIAAAAAADLSLPEAVMHDLAAAD